MDDKLKQFIWDHQQDVKTHGYIHIYKDIAGSYEYNGTRPQYTRMITEMFMNAGLNPLLYLHFVPSFYLYESDKCNGIVIPEGITSIFLNAYARSNIDKLVIPSTCTDINFRSFAQCNELKEIVINTHGKLDISRSAFSDSASILKVTLPKDCVVDLSVFYMSDPEIVRV